MMSTVIVSKGCVEAAYEDTENFKPVFKFGSSCPADVLKCCYNAKCINKIQKNQMNQVNRNRFHTNLGN